MVSSLRVPLTVTERRNVVSKRRSRDAIFPISFLEGELDRSKINSDRRGGEGRGGKRMNFWTRIEGPANHLCYEDNALLDLRAKMRLLNRHKRKEFCSRVSMT